MIGNEPSLLFIELFADTREYITKAIEFVKPIWVIVLTIVTWIMFPEITFLYAGLAVFSLCLLDVLTKYIALSKKHGGFRKALKEGHIHSSKLWIGTYKKLKSYFLIMILAGLSVRIMALAQMSNIIATIAYFFMLIRELQSNIENGIEAGYDNLKPLLRLLKRKEKDIIDKIFDDNDEKDRR